MSPFAAVLGLVSLLLLLLGVADLVRGRISVPGALVLLSLGLIGLACTINFPTPTGGDTVPVIVMQNQNSHNVGATDGGTSPTAPGAAVVASSVRVGIFTQTCPDSGPVPDNAQNAIRKDCAAKLTATPKDANNADLNLPEAVFQAMSVSWAIAGGSCADLGDDGNKFNRVVKGTAVGTCSICATVNGLQGCARQPTGEPLVRVQ
jgi:hypothetical protein